MKKRIPLRKYMNKLSDVHQVFGLRFYIPEEIIKANLVIREIHLDNIYYYFTLKFLGISNCYQK